MCFCFIRIMGVTKIKLDLWHIPTSHQRQMLTYRKIVYDPFGIADIRNKHNGKNDVFITKYAYNMNDIVKGKKKTYSKVILDGLFIDLDGKFNKRHKQMFRNKYHENTKRYNEIMKRVTEINQRLSYRDMLMTHLYLELNDILHIVFFSGRNFQVHVFSPPYEVVNLIKLGLSIGDAQKVVLYNMQLFIDCKVREYAKEKYNVPYYGTDSAVLGDISRLVRKENTINMRSKLYCIPLTDELIHSGLENIIRISKNVQKDYDIIGSKLMSFAPFDKPQIKSNCRSNLNSNMSVLNDKNDFDLGVNIDDNEAKTYLISVLPPCLFSIFDNEPPHIIRWQVVRLMYDFAMSRQSVFNILKGLNWIDFDDNLTRYQIDNIYDTAKLSGSEVRDCEFLEVDGYCVKNCPGFEDSSKFVNDMIRGDSL